ncbi:DUF2490 domain-containing protein [Hyunsoonleella ulvae]|uniref:DUF2490 domain-containing protein n=1 Tax=Hyunsoonleella ulvae TaxID=2799948 RepID=UPI001939E7E6|nr:DUF2490 domain-containing protein [Hyunsoonleella ulvae]
MLPNLNIGFKLYNGWTLNSRVEARQVFSEGNFNKSEILGSKYLFTDVTNFVSKKIYNKSFGGGYLTRFGRDIVMHRFIQQYLYIREYSTFKLSHRLRADQSFEVQNKPEFRFRYRIALEKPINGQTLNLNEFYFKLNNEYLNKFKEGYDIEVRIVPLLGYTLSEKERLEFGLDYRVAAFIKASETEHKFWLRINYYWKL